jgi:hypothetical protein
VKEEETDRKHLSGKKTGGIKKKGGVRRRNLSSKSEKREKKEKEVRREKEVKKEKRKERGGKTCAEKLDKPTYESTIFFKQSAV